MLCIQSLHINFEIEYLYKKNLKEQVENKIITQIENNSKSLVKLYLK